MKNEPKRTGSRGLLIAAIIIILALVIGWHLILPFLGLTIAIGAGAIGFVIAATVLLCIVIILFFISAGVLVWVMALLVAVWTLFTITYIPVAFPILIPLLVILIFIGILRRRS